MKDLPKVFANKIEKVKNNNKEYYVSKKKIKREDINKKITDIFSSYKYVYKADVIIDTEDDQMITKIIGKKGNNLITIDNTLINIDTILDIKLKD